MEKKLLDTSQNQDIILISNIILLNAIEFEANCLIKGVYIFVITISDIVNNNTLSTPLITILSQYFDSAEVFSKKVAKTLTEYGPQNLALQIFRISSFRLLYNFS